jgi:lysozyme
MKSLSLPHRHLPRSLLLLACLVTGIATAATPNARLEGVDTSHHNAAVNWTTLHDNGVRFVFVKATDGKDYLDPAFADNFRAAREAGLLRGAYHFYETDDDGVAQAQWFIRNVDLQPGDLPPVVDIERINGPVDGNLDTQFEAFLSTLEAHYGQPPIIYTGPNFWDHTMREHFPNHPLWVAQYDVSAPTLPDGWSAWAFWQYTETWQPPGTTAPIDGSVFNGDETSLQALLVPSTVTTQASNPTKGPDAH